LRMYARERLDTAGETAALAERHARWALVLAQQERDSPRLDRDAANLRAALDTLLARDPRTALRCCVACTPFWLSRIELEAATRRGAARRGRARLPERHARARHGTGRGESRRGRRGRRVAGAVAGAPVPRRVRRGGRLDRCRRPMARARAGARPGRGLRRRR